MARAATRLIDRGEGKFPGTPKVPPPRAPRNPRDVVPHFGAAPWAFGRQSVKKRRVRTGGGIATSFVGWRPDPGGWQRRGEDDQKIGAGSQVSERTHASWKRR